jgi:uncharacterized protein
MRTKKTALFLFLAFGISWITAGALYLAGMDYGKPATTFFIAIFYMMAPAIAAVIVHSGINKQPLKGLGLNFKETKWKSFLWVFVAHTLFCGFVISLILFFGNLLHVEEFGFFSLSQELLDGRMGELSAQMGGASPKTPFSPGVLFLITFIASITIGGVINVIFTLGEELGWRGFLQNEFQHLGFWKSNIIIGTIWGLWHAPVILQGHNYPEHRVAGVFVMIPFCICLGFILSWLRIKTRSVLAPALLHGMLNAIGGGIVLFSYKYNDLVGSIAGLAGIGGAAIVVLLIWIFDKKTILSFSETKNEGAPAPMQ